MDRLDAMEAFVAVCNAEGFAPAARRLGVSASAVTRLIAGLEQRLGVRLFQRTTRSVRLTNAGERYLQRARRILLEIEEAEDVAQSEGATPRGRLVVSAPLLFGRMHVGPLVRHYLERYPKVRAELYLSDHMVNLVEEGIDLAIRIGRLEDSALVAKKLGETQRVLVASPEYLHRRGRPERPEELAHHRTIVFSGLSTTTDWRFEEDGRELRVRIGPSLATNSGEVALEHARAGGGLACALGYQVRDLVRSGELEIVLSRFEPPASPIQAVYPSARFLAARVRALIDIMAAETDWGFVNLEGPLTAIRDAE